MARYYIAYGSNLNIKKMRRRCPAAVPVGISELQDYRLLFKGDSGGFYLTIEPKAGSQVPVAVWSVTAADERALDRYEGYPSLYYKKTLRIQVREREEKAGRVLSAFVYIMYETFHPGFPDRAYFEECREGYRNFGFDERCLQEAAEAGLETAAALRGRPKRA